MRYATVSLDALPIGARLGASIYDSRQVKLVAAGLEITEQLVENLRVRDVSTVAVSVGDLCKFQAFAPQGRARSVHPERKPFELRYHTDLSRELDAIGEILPIEDLEPSSNPFASRVKKPMLEKYDKQFTRDLVDSHEKAIEQLDQMMVACKQGDSSEMALIEQAVAQALAETAEDMDAFVCLSANPMGHSYPSRHSRHIAMLATAIGTTLGLDERTLQELGMGCLIHDIGMTAIDRRAFEARKVLEQDEFVEIAKHPFKTFDIISNNLDLIPVNARMVAYQIHERFNGEGYPRRRAGEAIHPLARIAAVADAYSALVSPRPHRPGMMPYYAMEKMVRDTSRGLFDPKVVRALLETVGLFPIGSLVELTNDFVGRVIRSSGKQYSRPIMELWKRGNVKTRPSIVDLSQDNTLQILKPLLCLEDF